MKTAFLRVFMLLGLFVSVTSPGIASGTDYTYDSLNRLTQVVYSDGSVVGYTYDAAGNRLTQNIARVTQIAPSITSNTSATFSVGQAGSFAVTATGTPAPTFSAAGLPAWAHLDPMTGLLSGTPPNMAGAPFTVTLTATNGTAPDATQVFTLNVQAPILNALFSDNFDANTVDPTKWTTSGNTVVDAGGIMQVETTVTDQPGTLTSTPITVSNNGIITIARSVFLHRDVSMGHYFQGYFSIKVGTVPLFGVSYYDYDYSDSLLQPTHGFFLGRNGASADTRSQQADISPAIPPIWDAWFNEKITYDPVSGIMEYFINNVSQATLNVGVLPTTSNPTMTLSFQAYGWWTGHYQNMDNLTVTQNTAPTFTSTDHTSFTVGQRNVFNLTASGNPAPSFSASNLPSWLSLNSITGVLSGSPPNTTGSPFSLNLTATNGASPNATQVFNLTVQNPAPVAITSWTGQVSGTTNSISNVIYAMGKYVAVGVNGTIVTSSDGSSWVTRTSGTGSSLMAICYGNGVFVAGGVDGTILVSSDGITWTNYLDREGGSIYTISYGNGVFVASGQAGILQTSTDGINWTAEGTLGTNVYASTFANGHFVMAGYYNLPGNQTVGRAGVSTDGIVWNFMDIGASANPIVFKSLSFGNGVFVGVGDNGEVGTSADGLSWTTHVSGTTQPLTAVSYFGQFVAVGAGGLILVSPDGFTWTPVSSGISSGLNGAVHGNGTFFLVGDSGVILKSNIVSPLDLFWDATTATGLANGNGAWDNGVTAKWSYSSAGASNPLLTWQNDSSAFFQTAGTLIATVPAGATIKVGSLTQSVAGTAATVSGGTLQIDNNSGIVNASGNHSLTINSAIALNSPNVAIDNEVNVGSIVLNGTISEMGGSCTITKIGTGAVQFGTAINTFSGGVILNSPGQVAFSNNSSFGTGAITFNAGSSLTSTAQIYTASTGSAGSLANNLVITPGSFGAYTGDHTMILGGSLMISGTGSGTFAITPGSHAASVTLSGDNHAFVGTVVYNDNGVTPLLLGSTNSGSANAIWTLTGGKVQGIAANVTGNNSFLLGEVTSASGIGRLFSGQSTGTATFQMGDMTANSPSFGGVFADGTAGGIVALTKTGLDNQIMTGSQTFTGPTTISNGTLTVNGSLAAGSTVTVNLGAALAGSGKINGATNLSSGGIISPGGDGKAAALTFAGGLNLNASSVLNFDLATTTTSDKIAVTGAYIAPASGAVTINLNALSGFSSGTYPLVTGASGISAASFTLGSSPSAYTYQLSVSGSTLSVTVGNAPAPPTGLAATSSTGEVDLAWTASTGATSYNVLRGPTSGGPYPMMVATGLTSVNYADKSVTNGTTYYYVVTATNAAGTSGNSSQAGATPSGATIDTYWSDTDIGSVGQVGSASYIGGTFALNGSGLGVTGTADSLDYTYQTLVGDGTIIARVASQASGASGVLMRETLDANARVVATMLQANVGAIFQSRTDIGGSAVTGPALTSASIPYWVKLARVGAVFSGYVSPDGVTWTFTGSVTNLMVPNIYVGLAQSSLTNASLATGTFSNVSVVPTSDWASQDIGTVQIVGGSNYSNGVATVAGAGASLYTGADQFRYTYLPASGDCDITARVASESNTNTSAKVGVMIRAGLTATAAHTFVYVTPGSGIGFEWRSTTGGVTTATTTTGLKAPYWLRLVRSGNTFTAYRSIDGNNWTMIGSQTITMPTAVYIGLPVCSYNTSTSCTATFDNIIADP